jgi:hypothetical protein
MIVYGYRFWFDVPTANILNKFQVSIFRLHGLKFGTAGTVSASCIRIPGT